MLSIVFLLPLLLLLENVLPDENQSPYQKGRTLKPSGNKLIVFLLYATKRDGGAEQRDLFFKNKQNKTKNPKQTNKNLAASVFVKETCVCPLFDVLFFFFLTVVTVSLQSKKSKLTLQQHFLECHGLFS